MIQEIGEFAIQYSEDLTSVIIAYTAIASGLATFTALHKRLCGLIRPTGEYSHIRHKDNLFFGVHFENTITEERLKQALSQ